MREDSTGAEAPPTPTVHALPSEPVVASRPKPAVTLPLTGFGEPPVRKIPPPPPLLVLAGGEQAYRIRFEKTLCTKRVCTFDGIEVRVRSDHFNHCSFRSKKRNGQKDEFCPTRASYIEWIQYSLEIPNNDLWVGYDRKTGKLNPLRRVSIVENKFLSVIELFPNDRTRAVFVTAFAPDTPDVFRKIRRGQQWAQKKCR